MKNLKVKNNIRFANCAMKTAETLGYKVSELKIYKINSDGFIETLAKINAKERKIENVKM